MRTRKMCSQCTLLWRPLWAFIFSFTVSFPTATPTLHRADREKKHRYVRTCWVELPYRCGTRTRSSSRRTTTTHHTPYRSRPKFLVPIWNHLLYGSISLCQYINIYIYVSQTWGASRHFLIVALALSFYAHTTIAIAGGCGRQEKPTSNL
jgi:hypothetical protein